MTAPEPPAPILRAVAAMDIAGRCTRLELLMQAADDREPEAARHAWRRLRNRLQSRGLLGVCKGVAWLP